MFDFISNTSPKTDVMHATLNSDGVLYEVTTSHCDNMSVLISKATAEGLARLDVLTRGVIENPVMTTYFTSA